MTPNSYINRHHPNIFTSNTYNQAASSSSCIITRDFFNSSCSQDQSEYLYYQDQQLQQPELQQHQAENLASQGASCQTENEVSDNGLKFCIWKQENKYENHEQTTHYQVKWMSSKMKKKEAASTTTTNTTNSTVLSTKLDDQDQKQEPSSSPMETDQNSSNSTNSSNSMISNMSPIRVCSDCSTTKTPLWRSGPQGPKSLCNACGIRQRKARRAIAAAAANGTALEIKTTPPLVLKTKKYNKTKTRQQKDKTSSSCGHVANFKTRICNLNAATSTHDNVVEPPKKLCFEDFLLNLTNNLDYHQVFPQDEKDAAILLMALSWDHQAYNH